MINLDSPLTFKNAYLFPIQTKESKKEILIGGLLLLIPIVGWLLNMGHRISFVRKMQRDQNPFPSWSNYSRLFKDGLITFIGMLFYFLPSLRCLAIGNIFDFYPIYFVSGVLFIFAVIIIPGYMTHFCYDMDVKEIFKPIAVISRVYHTGPNYWRAWKITISALLLSFLGLLFFDVGFLFTSVWFWQVAGFSFANVFTKKYNQ